MARAGGGRPRVVLGLPAPRQPRRRRTGPEDDLWRSIADHTGDDELDITSALDDLADRADQEPTSYRWSFSRDFDDQARLVVVDSRAARVLEPDRRSMLDDDEMAWLDERMRGDVDHLLVGTSLPLLMAPELHHVEAFGEALAQGAWGRLGSTRRRGLPSERRPRALGGVPGRLRPGRPDGRRRRERAPRPDATVGHVPVRRRPPQLRRRRPGPTPRSGSTLDAVVVQATCSPIRNPLPGRDEGRHQAGAPRARRGRPGGCSAARCRAHRCAGEMTRGPWYDNNLAVVELQDDRLHFWWSRGRGARGRRPAPARACRHGRRPAPAGLSPRGQAFAGSLTRAAGRWSSG